MTGSAPCSFCCSPACSSGRSPPWCETTVAEPVRWRLVSRYHPDVDEPAEGASLKIAAALLPYVLDELRLVGAGGLVLCRVPLREDGRSYTPVFYRRRSLVLDGSGESTLDAIVFGRQRERPDGGVNVTLWMLGRDGAAVDCPPEYIDRAACQDLLAAFTGG